jgi:hypothetical protein
VHCSESGTHVTGQSEAHTASPPLAWHTEPDGQVVTCAVQPEQLVVPMHASTPPLALHREVPGAQPVHPLEEHTAPEQPKPSWHMSPVQHGWPSPPQAGQVPSAGQVAVASQAGPSAQHGWFWPPQSLVLRPLQERAAAAARSVSRRMSRQG